MLIEPIRLGIIGYDYLDIMVADPHTTVLSNNIIDVNGKNTIQYVAQWSPTIQFGPNYQMNNQRHWVDILGYFRQANLGVSVEMPMGHMDLRPFDLETYTPLIAYA